MQFTENCKIFRRPIFCVIIAGCQVGDLNIPFQSVDWTLGYWIWNRLKLSATSKSTETSKQSEMIWEEI